MDPTVSLLAGFAGLLKFKLLYAAMAGAGVRPAEPMNACNGCEPCPLLTARERECLKLAVEGKSDWEIGDKLSLSEKTVNTYIQRVKAKYGVATRTQAIARALETGF